MLSDQARQVDLRIGRIDVSVQAVGLVNVKNIAFANSGRTGEHPAFTDYAVGRKRFGLGRNGYGHIGACGVEFPLRVSSVGGELSSGDDARQAFHVGLYVLNVILHKRDQGVILFQFKRLEPFDYSAVVSLDYRLSVFLSQSGQHGLELGHLIGSHAYRFGGGLICRRGRSGSSAGGPGSRPGGGLCTADRGSPAGAERTDLVNVSSVYPESNAARRFDLVELEAIDNRTDNLDGGAGFQYSLTGGELGGPNCSSRPGPLAFDHGSFGSGCVRPDRRGQHNAVAAFGGHDHQPALFSPDNSNRGRTVKNRTVIIVVCARWVSTTGANTH